MFSGPERRRRWSDEERLRIVAEAFAPGACVADVCRRHGVSEATIYNWKAKYGGLEVSGASHPCCIHPAEAALPRWVVSAL